MPALSFNECDCENLTRMTETQMECRVCEDRGVLMRTMYWNTKREYRCTRNASGTNVLLERQGHYVKAHSLWHAIELIAAKFPQEADKNETWDAKATKNPNTFVTKNFTITLWK